MAMKLTDEQRNADNLLRQLNTNLKNAHKNLGENSQQYRNLVMLGSSYGLEVRQDKNGVYQYKRDKNALNACNDTVQKAMKEEYYHTDKNGKPKKDKFKKNVIDYKYNVTTKVNQIKENAKKYFNTPKPTAKQMVYMSEQDILVSEFWYQYADAKDDEEDYDYDRNEDPNRADAYRDIANKIYGGYDITNKPQTEEDFDRLHGLVTDALALDNNRLVVNMNGYKIDANTGEVIGAVTPEAQAVFDKDYFSGDDWLSIME